MFFNRSSGVVCVCVGVCVCGGGGGGCELPSLPRRSGSRACKDEVSSSSIIVGHIRQCGLSMMVFRYRRLSREGDQLSREDRKHILEVDALTPYGERLTCWLRGHNLTKTV
jgi:hypothetical protein